MKLAQPIETKWRIWLRGVDLNHRPLGYEPNELPDCSTPRFDDNNRGEERQTSEHITRMIAQKPRTPVHQKQARWEEQSDEVPKRFYAGTTLTSRYSPSTRVFPPEA